MAQRFKGDVTIDAGVTSQYGTGALTVFDEIKLASTTGTRKVRTTGASTVFSLESLNALNLAAGASSTWQTTTGSIAVTGQAGITATATSGNIGLVSTIGNVNLTTSATSGNITLTAGTATGTLGLYGKTITLGDANTGQVNIATTTSTPITIGVAGNTTTIAGNLIVSGTTTTINTSTLDVADNLIVVNSAPSAAAKDAGVLFKRHKTDVAADTATVTTALNANVSAAATTIVITDIAANYTGYTVKLNDGVHNETFVVTAATVGATQTLTLDSALVNGYATSGPATVVTLYSGTFTSMHYNETADEFAFAYTPSLETATTVSVGRYANMRANNIVATGNITANGSFSSGGFKSLVTSLGADVATGSAVEVSTTTADLKTRGSYLFQIESVATDGATAIFSLSKSAAGDIGSVFRITSTPGANLEELDMKWAANEKPKFFHSPIRQTGTLNQSLSYNIRLISTS